MYIKLGTVCGYQILPEAKRDMARELELLMELEKELSKLAVLEAKSEVEALNGAPGVLHDAPAIVPAGASLTLTVHAIVTTI